MNYCCRGTLLFSFVASVAALHAQPVISSGGILNNASYSNANGLARGSLVAIFGSGLGPSQLAQVSAFPLPTLLGGTSVTFRQSNQNWPASVIYTSAAQVGVIVPNGLAEGAATVTLTYQGQTSSSRSITVVRSGLGLFTVNQQGFGQAIIQNVQGDQLPINGASSPTRPGGLIIIWGTGMGPVDGEETNGPAPGDQPSFGVRVKIGTRYAKVTYSGRSGCCSSIDQIVAEVPAGVSGCALPMVIESGGVESNPTTIAVTSDGSPCTNRREIDLIFTATPLSGPIPLTVRFASRADTQNGSVIRYRYDLDGDGQFELDDNPAALAPQKTYSKPGLYTATFEARTDVGVVERTSLQVTATGRPPTATALASPAAGPAGTPVTFSVTASDPDGFALKKFEWDFQGDGVYDFESATKGDTTFTYNFVGTFQPVLRITDAEGLTATLVSPWTTVRIGPVSSPTVSIATPAPSLSPRLASASAISFDAIATGVISKYEWDFEGDGVFDTSSTVNARASFAYSLPGHYKPTIRVTDALARTASATGDINVVLTSSLTLTRNTVKASSQLTAGIQVSLSRAAPVSVLIRNGQGAVVRKVVDRQSRPTSFTETWDAKDDAGKPVPVGVYYAILQYGSPEDPVTVDSSKTSGGVIDALDWTMSTTAAGAACSTCAFNPLKNDQLQVNFTLTKAAEVTVGVWKFNSTEELVRLTSFKQLGQGGHTVYWDGTDAQGHLIQPELRDQFLFTVVAYSLPDNAIFIDTAPEVENLSVAPGIFNPSVDGSGLGNVRISYRLTLPGELVAEVINMDSGRAVRTWRQTSGANENQTIDWDGRTANGVLAAPGDYRIRLVAQDPQGGTSITRWVPLKIFY